MVSATTGERPGDDFETMWADLRPIGRSADSGGYLRLPFAAAERECVAWFVEQCSARGLVVEEDRFGNLVGWWRPEGVGRGATAVLTGSHLDSVLDGGAYDGPLGVVSALAAVDRLREQGFVPTRPIGVAVFVAEEGSRFGIACLGSRLATGQLTAEAAAGLAGPDQVPWSDALADSLAGSLTGSLVVAGGDPADHGRPDLLTDVGCYVELHVEQGRNLVDLGAPVGVASGIWPHGRYRFDFTGEANHAGSTRMEDRHDPMLGYAMTVLAANKQARLAGARATFGRVRVGPNQTNAVPSRVTGWLDARAAGTADLDELVAQITRLADERAGRDGVRLTVTAESVTGAVHFDDDLTRRLGPVDGPGWPAIPSQAGHDAGILAEAGIPTAMIFVRNPTGVSHAPAESAEMPDCLAGVAALADALTRLAGCGP